MNTEEAITNGQSKDTCHIGYATQYVLHMCHYAQANTNNVNKTLDPLQTIGGKDELNILSMRKSQRTSQRGTRSVTTHNRTTQKLKRLATRTP